MGSVVHQGTSPFRRWNWAVHSLGYATCAAVWALSYVTVLAVVPVSDALGVAAGATGASVIAGVYAGTLYRTAVGSPIGDVLLPGLLPFLVPLAPLTPPRFPGSVLRGPNDPTVLLIAPALVAGPVAAMTTIGFHYGRMDDPVTWERRVMPQHVRVVDDSRSGDRPHIAPRVTAAPPTEVDYRRGVTASIVAVTAVVLAAFVGERVAGLELAHLGGAFLVAIAFVLARTVTYGGFSEDRR